VIRLLAITLALAMLPPLAAQTPDTGGTRVVLLGTGTPNADPDRSGPAVAVIVNGSVYLVDAGPGIVRRAAAARRAGVAALEMENLTRVFITHLHHDHTLGLGDLIFTPWTLGRTAPLAVYGPAGIRAMTDHLSQAYTEDIRMRLDGLEPANETGYVVQAHEITPGVVYRDSNVTVTAFAVPHGSWPLAVGYKFVARDRTIVISGDTRASDAIAAACQGCDVLVHEVYAQAGWEKIPTDWQRYHASFHTSAVDLGRIAARAGPKLLVLYHQLPWSATPEQILAEIARSFRGRVAYGKDLDVF
jgi:ribonuclease BN (tRNA processing enzyme)